MILYVLYRLFDYRHVYLGRTTARSGRFKIGIARNVEQRWADINRAISGGREYPIFHARCLFAGRLEKALHRKYKHYRVKEKGWGREWFRLPVLARFYVIYTIISHSFVSVSVLLIAATAFALSYERWWPVVAELVGML